MTRTISIWETYQRSRIAWRRLRTVRGRRSSVTKRAAGWPNVKTGVLSRSEPSDAIAEQSSHAEVAPMCGLGRHRPALPSGLLARRGGKAVMTVLLWEDTQQARCRSNNRLLPHALALARQDVCGAGST